MIEIIENIIIIILVILILETLIIISDIWFPVIFLPSLALLNQRPCSLDDILLGPLRLIPDLLGPLHVGFHGVVYLLQDVLGVLYDGFFVVTFIYFQLPQVVLLS